MFILSRFYASIVSKMDIRNEAEGPDEEGLLDEACGGDPPTTSEFSAADKPSMSSPNLSQLERQVQVYLAQCKTSTKEFENLYLAREIKRQHLRTDGYFESLSTGQCVLKSQGSCKINATCPAKMTAKFSSKLNLIFVEYISTHVGHDAEPGHERIPRHGREMIIEKLKNKIPPRVIIDDIRDNIPEKSRLSKATTKDLRNMKFAAGIDKEHKLHPDDATSVHLWIERNVHGKIKCSIFMSDDFPAFSNAWSSVMEDNSFRKLLCTWHVDRAWQNRINLKTEEDKPKLLTFEDLTDCHENMPTATNHEEESKLAALTAQSIVKLCYSKLPYAKHPDEEQAGQMADSIIKELERLTEAAILKVINSPESQSPDSPHQEPNNV
ncbi:hypothetical protein B566_EDAN012354 [Ephemera danica]|nr:hypothetical protein B566_EDAN012354 [Ephemera danica]